MFFLQEQIRQKNIRIRELSTHDEFENRKVREWQDRIKDHMVVLVDKQTKLTQNMQNAENIGSRPNNIR